MPAKKDGITRVRTLVAKLEGVDAGTSYGFPAFKVKGKTFAWFPDKKEVEPGSLGVRVSFEDRDYLIGKNPKVFYYTPHYEGYPAVLVRVDKLADKPLRELLEVGYEFVLASTRKKK